MKHRLLILLQFCDVFGITFIHKIHVDFDTLISRNIYSCSFDFSVSKKHFCLNFTIIFLSSFTTWFGAWQRLKCKSQGSARFNTWIRYELQDKSWKNLCWNEEINIKLPIVRFIKFESSIGWQFRRTSGPQRTELWQNPSGQKNFRRKRSGRAGTGKNIPDNHVPAELPDGFTDCVSVESPDSCKINALSEELVQSISVPALAGKVKYPQEQRFRPLGGGARSWSLLPASCFVANCSLVQWNLWCKH